MKDRYEQLSEYITNKKEVYFLVDDYEKREYVDYVIKRGKIVSISQKKRNCDIPPYKKDKKVVTYCSIDDAFLRWKYIDEELIFETQEQVGEYIEKERKRYGVEHRLEIVNDIKEIMEKYNITLEDLK